MLKPNAKITNLIFVNGVFERKVFGCVLVSILLSNSDNHTAEF